MESGDVQPRDCFAVCYNSYNTGYARLAIRGCMYLPWELSPFFVLALIVTKRRKAGPIKLTKAY
jgi:hypothetical protein